MAIRSKIGTRNYTYRFMLRRETLAMSENQLKRLLVVLCALTVVLTLVSAINALLLLTGLSNISPYKRRGIGWSQMICRKVGPFSSE